MSGAIVLSLDFELHWGVRSTESADGDYRKSLINARSAVSKTLELFQEFDIAATWATVGMLFAETSELLSKFSPQPNDRPPAGHCEIPAAQKVACTCDLQLDLPLQQTNSLVWLPCGV